MEFTARAVTRIRDADLQRHVRIDNLPQWCASISKVLLQQGDKGEIYSTWGQFRIHREVIHNGVRFTLPTCPNALQWTVTAGEPLSGQVLIHCTLAGEEHDLELVESLERFVADWKTGLESGAGQPAPRPTAGECMPWFG